MSQDAHSRPSRPAEAPLYDPDVPTPSHAERVRTLLAGIRTGTLSTIASQPAGYPYGSFVTYAMDAAEPLFFISVMAEHTKNLLADARASLLVAEGGASDPLANGRVTLLGRARQLEPGPERDTAREAYLATHPNARYYVEYSDFAFWRLEVEAIRYIGGYGRMSWVEVGDYRAAEPDPIAPHAQAILEHMNADHGQALVGYCRALTKATDTTRAVMTGVDRYGFELSAMTGDGPRPIRLPFSRTIATADEARRELVSLARRTRAAAE